MKKRSKSGKRSSKKVWIKILLTFIVIAVAIGCYFLYFNFFVAKECKDLECYNSALSNCKKVWVINEGEDHVWRYEILNKEDQNTCNVQVRLLKIKKGVLNTEDLEGKTMICKVKPGDILPEEDMLRCSGPLREEFQEIIIDRMHNYLLQNIGQINEEFKAA